MLKVSRAVTQFAKGEVSETEKNSLPISFRILERGDGAAGQIIYAGKLDSRVRMEGTIEGAGQPIARVVERDSKEQASKPLAYGTWGIAFFLTGLTVYQIIGRHRKGLPFIRQELVATIPALMLIGLAVYTTYQLKRTFEATVPPTIQTK